MAGLQGSISLVRHVLLLAIERLQSSGFQSMSAAQHTALLGGAPWGSAWNTANPAYMPMQRHLCYFATLQVEQMGSPQPLFNQRRKSRSTPMLFCTSVGVHRPAQARPCKSLPVQRPPAALTCGHPAALRPHHMAQRRAADAEARPHLLVLIGDAAVLGSSGPKMSRHPVYFPASRCCQYSPVKA